MSYEIPTNKMLAAIMEIMFDIVAGQLATNQTIFKYMAANDEELYQHLLQAYSLNVKEQWRHVYEAMYKQYGALPGEVWEILNERKTDK